MILVHPTYSWWHTEEPAFGLMNVVSRTISNFERQYFRGLPNLRGEANIFIASDYSGSHKDALYEAMSFLVATSPSIGDWLPQQQYIRLIYLPDGRRLSYKGLNDQKKRGALSPFLSAANGLHGVIFSALIDKRLDRLFQAQEQSSADAPELVDFSEWRPRAIERMLRSIHFVSLLLRGLSAPGQNVLWISDQDDIVANEIRHRQVVKACGTVLNHYLPHNLGHIRFGTTASDTGARELEDLVAIPDLVAGALTDIIPGLVSRTDLSAHGLFIPAYSDVKDKAGDLMNWFSDNTQPLKRLVLIIDPSADTTKCRVTCVRFHGSGEITS